MEEEDQGERQDLSKERPSMDQTREEEPIEVLSDGEEEVRTVGDGRRRRVLFFTSFDADFGTSFRFAQALRLADQIQTQRSGETGPKKLVPPSPPGDNTPSRSPKSATMSQMVRWL